MNEAFEAVVGVAGNVDREVTVYDVKPKQGIVFGHDLYESARKDLFERTNRILSKIFRVAVCMGTLWIRMKTH